MPVFLSDAWFERRAELVVGLRVPPATADGPAAVGGGPVRVQCVVTGGPSGDVTCHGVARDGWLDALAGGPDDDAALRLTAPYDVATAVATGELAPAVAYMQGRLKAAGDLPTLHALLAGARRPPASVLAAALHAETEV